VRNLEGGVFAIDYEIRFELKVNTQERKHRGRKPSATPATVSATATATVTVTVTVIASVSVSVSVSYRYVVVTSFSSTRGIDRCLCAQRLGRERIAAEEAT
jgi:hypothetical protein